MNRRSFLNILSLAPLAAFLGLRRETLGDKVSYVDLSKRQVRSIGHIVSYSGCSNPGDRPLSELVRSTREYYEKYGVRAKASWTPEGFIKTEPA